MDIWEWVTETTEELRKQGHGRLAELIDVLPTACCDAEHERVESIVPEALALARGLKHPWLELFIRHWLLQSRVLHRHDVSHDTLSQAVSLVEFAARPETRDCPQSMCAVQDLASAYGLVDGVGYAEQRLAVTAEALARIDPTWPCFDCVSSERIGALRDLGRHQEALEFCERQLAERPASLTGLSCNRVRGLSVLGRKQEAAQAAEQINLENAGESGAITKALLQCLTLARLGEKERALGLLPVFSRLEPEHFDDWLRCLRELGVAEGYPNTWRVERAIQAMNRALSKNASHFILANIHKMGAQLALQRGARLSAGRHLDLARQAAARLLSPAGVLAKLAAVSAELDKLPSAEELPQSVEELQQRLGSDPELDLELITRSGLLPDVRLARAEAAAWYALGATSDAQQVLEVAFLKWPSDVKLTLQLLETLLAQGDHERLEVLCGQAIDEAAEGAQWVLARSLKARGDLASVRARCLDILAENAAHHDARQLLAETLRDVGEFDAALVQLTALVETHDPGSHDWDRMLVATLAGRWDLVRASAARLELPVREGEEGPIDERWGACRIRVRLADGQYRAFFAWRMGPVTARIDEVAAPGEEQHHGDLVVFDAVPLNEAEVNAKDEDEDEDEGAESEDDGEDDESEDDGEDDESEDDGEDDGEDDESEDQIPPIWEYAAYATLDRGNFRAFAVDGFAPSDDELETLKGDIDEFGIVWEQRSGESYQLLDEGESLPATFAYLGVPETCTDAQAHQALAAAVQRLSLRLVWPKLAAAAGDTETERAHLELSEAWGVE